MSSCLETASTNRGRFTEPARLSSTKDSSLVARGGPAFALFCWAEHRMLVTAHSENARAIAIARAARVRGVLAGRMLVKLTRPLSCLVGLRWTLGKLTRSRQRFFADQTQRSSRSLDERLVVFSAGSPVERSRVRGHLSVSRCLRFTAFVSHSLLRVSR